MKILHSLIMLLILVACNSPQSTISPGNGSGENDNTTPNTLPNVSSQSLSVSFNTQHPLTLSGSDADNDPLTYSIVSSPSHGLLSGSAPNLTYTPYPEYYGNDSFTFKASDGKGDSSSATVSLTVVQPPTVYLSTSGDDQTAILNDESKPYRTVTAAYVAANTYQVSNGGVILIKLGAGTFDGITLTNDWNSNIHLIGEDSTTTFLGGINGDGHISVFYPQGMGNVAGCRQYEDFGSGYIDQGECHTPATRGRHIELHGRDINIGNISSSTAYSFDWGIWEPEYLEQVRITLNPGIEAIDIVSNNQYYASLPGRVTIKNGAKARDITVNSVEAGGAAGNDPINGGTVIVEGIARNIEARGRDNQVDNSGIGGTVTIEASGVVNTIDVRGGGFAFLSGGAIAYDCVNSFINCYWSNGMGKGGTVIIKGTSGDIIADGGAIPTRAQSTTFTQFYAGEGGSVTVQSGGIAGNISASASPTSNTNYNTFGASGGTVIVSGRAGNINVNGSAAGNLAPENSNRFACYDYDDCLDPISGGHGGRVTVNASAIVGNITANAGTAHPPYWNGNYIYAYTSIYDLNVNNMYLYFLQDGGIITLSQSATYGTLSYSSASDGVNSGAPGQLITIP